MLMMVGNDHKKTKSRTKESKTGGNMKKSSSRSGRTSPGLNVKRFTIPKKQKELLNEVELDSSEYLREVLPIIQQGYRESSSKNKFNYEKVQLIHNPALKKEFIEKKREMKDAGRNEKELIESYAFLCVKTEEKAKQLCQESLHAGTKERKRQHCLGSPSMGVHVCRYSDVLHRSAVPKEGILLLVKILKGKVKAVPLVYGAAEILEPTPNYDCHVAKNSGEELPSSASHRLFDSSELFIYDFDEDEVEFRKRPRNICPYAIVHFTYSDTGVASALPSSSNFNRTPVASSNETTPSRNISVPDTVGIAVVAPCFPRDEIVSQYPMSDADRPFIEKYKEYSERSYRVWSGQLLNKNGNSCRVSLVSFGLSFLPCKMPEALQACKAVRMKELRLPTKVFTGTVPVLSRVKEAQANGKYYWYAELHSLSLDDAVYSRFLNYLSEKELVLKKDLGDRVLLYILPTGKTTQNLGLTASSHPKILHCLVESYVPMVSHLTDITVKQPRHQVKPNLESAPIHDIDKDHLKRLRFQSSLAKLFYEQNRELKDNGVKGDKEDIPGPVTVPRQSSVEQSSVEPDEPDVETVIEMSPASSEEQVDENLNSYIPRSQQLEHQQSNQRPASHSKSEASPVHKQHPADIHDWNNYPNDWRSEHPSSTQSWDHSHPQPNHQKEQSIHRVESKESRDPRVNIHKLLQPGGEPSNHHVSQQSPSSHPHSSNPGEHHRLGHQQYEQQSGRTENQSGHQSYERQSSNEWGPPKGSPRGRGSQSRSHRESHHHHQKHPPKPPDNQQYKRQASSDWTNQPPSAKHKPNQDKRPLEAPKDDLPPQIKEVASKVHKMLTSGIDMGLRGAAGDANVQTVQEETDDEKIARMRATLQALVEERERLAKSNSDKNSANPPTSVSPKGNEVLSSPSTNMDTTSEPKHPSPESPKESTVEKPNKSIVVEKPKENAQTKGNGNEADVRMEEAMDIVESDEGEEEEKVVQEKDIVKRKLEESEEPAKKKMRVDDVPTAEAERDKGVAKDSPVVPKSVVQKNIAIYMYGVKTVSKPVSSTDSTEQQPKGTTNQEPISAKGPVDPKKTEPMTKTQKDQNKPQTLEKKPKSDVEVKNRVSKKSESADKPSKVSKEITSASQMREYLERRHSSDKKSSKEHISSASEMKMFLENPDKVSTKPRRIKSASEMRQFLNQPFTRDKSSKTSGSEGHKGRPTAAAPDNARQYPELEGKSRDDLLKDHDGELTSNHLQNFLSTHHQITWSLSQDVRVTVKREMAGARIGPPPPGALRGGMDEEEDDCTSSIRAVCHGSYRSMNGTQPDTSTKEGLAYQIRQVIHHSQPVKKVEARKVKEIQKGGNRRRLSFTQILPESQDQGRGESPANIPDGKKRGNSKSTSKKQPRNIKLTTKKNSLSKIEAPSHTVGSKETSLQVPRKPTKLKIKKTKKSCTTITSSREAVEKEIVTTQAKKKKNKDNAMTQTGKPSGPYVSGKYLPKTKLDHQSSADKIIDRAQAVTEVDYHKGILPAVDVTEAVRDMVMCLSTDEIRQLIGVFDELFSSRPDINQSQPVPSDNKDGPDSMQLSTVDPQSCGDTGQSRLQRGDQGGGDKEEMVLLSPKKSVSKTSSDRKDHLADQGSLSQNKEKAECQVDDTKQLGEDHPLKRGVPFLHKVEAEHLVGDVKPFTDNHPQEMATPTSEMDVKEKPADDTKPTEDEDTLPYPLEPVQDGASGVDEVATGCTNDKVLLNEACIHLYDSDRWSELDDDMQADASKEHTLQESADQSRKVQPVDVGTTSLEKTNQPVKDYAGDTAVSLVSDTAQAVPSNKVRAAKTSQRTDMLSILISECENKTPIKKVTDKEHREGIQKVSIFERLSAVQPKTRNVVKDEKESADYHGMSLESIRYPEESGDKVKRNDSPQPTSSLPTLPEASQSILTISAGKGTEKDEKITKVTVFDRLNTKQPDQEPQKKRVSVFDRLYVPKTVKPEPIQTEPSKLERVSAFERLSARKVTKTSTQEKEKQKEDTSSRSSSSKVKKEKTTVISVMSSKVNKVDSVKATAGVASTVNTVKPKKADEVVQKERQKDMPKDVLKSKKRELPKEDVPANKKYKLAIKDQGDKKEKYKNQQKENVTSKKEDKLVSKDPVRRAEMYNDLPRKTVASSNKNKQTTKSHGKKEEKEIDLQRRRDTSSKKPLPDPRDHTRREKKYVDKRSDKRHVSRTREERKDRDHRRHDSRGRDSDHSSVSTKEDSDTIRQNILRRANDLASDFSKYVVSGRYLDSEGKSPSPLLVYDPDPVETPSNNITDRAGLDKCFNMAKERTAVDGYPVEVQSKYVSKTTSVPIQNNEETQPFSVQESYLVLDQTRRDINYSQVNEQQIHTISVIGGSTANSMRPFHEMSVDNDAITNGLPDDLPLDKISIMGNREGDGSSLEKIQTKILGEPYNSVSPEPSTTLSPEKKRAFEQALKGSIGSPIKQDYRPESPTDSIRSLSNGHQDQLLTKNDVPPPTLSYEESSSTFTQSTYERDNHSQDHEDSRKIKTSLKAPSTRRVHCGNRFHPYDKRLKTFQGHCHSLREPETAELIANFCKEEYRLRKLRAAARVSALSKDEEFFDQARLSPSRFGSLNEMNHDEGVIRRAEEVEMTHSREGAGDAVAGQRGDQLQILDRQIEALTASGSGIQDFFILDANVYPIKNGDDSALSGVPPKKRARRGRGRPPRHHGPPHPYQIRTHYQGHSSASSGYSQDRWNEPSYRSWNGPSQRSLDQWDRAPRYPPSSNFHCRKGH